MFVFKSVFDSFKKSFTDALSVALQDIEVKCNFSINCNGECKLENNDDEMFEDEIQEALEAIEFGDVQISYKYDIDIDWDVLKCMEPVHVWVEPGDDYIPVTVHLVCKDKDMFEKYMFKAGYEVPSPQKRERDDDEEEEIETPENKRPALIDLSSDDEVIDLTEE